MVLLFLASFEVKQGEDPACRREVAYINTELANNAMETCLTAVPSPEEELRVPWSISICSIEVTARCCCAASLVKTLSCGRCSLAQQQTIIKRINLGRVITRLSRYRSPAVSPLALVT